MSSHNTASSPVYDVAILGAGFSGSLLAQVLASRGMRVLLIDAQQHPRFAIGESSTPIADLLLEKLGQLYQLPALESLSRYGRWKLSHPELTCGPKRGFSYFSHSPNQPYYDTSDHRQALLVAASPDLDRADTHWLRSDVDAFFFANALRYGATFIHGRLLEVEEIQQTEWRLTLVGAGSQNTKDCRVRFIVDASGVSELQNPLRRCLGIKNDVAPLLTNSCATYGHFRNLGSWESALRDRNCFLTDYAFPCDQAAQHHLLDVGWLWMLRFDNDTTSVGWTRRWNQAANPGASKGPVSSQQQMFEMLGITKYASLQNLFANARLVTAHERQLFTTGRLQKLASKIAGPNYALLPTAAIVIDPLHSSGIAHGLSGVIRVAEILLASDDPQQRGKLLENYQRSIRQEAISMDRMVAGCYLAGNRLDLFASHAAFYFVAAIATEEAIANNQSWSTLWLADNSSFQHGLFASVQQLQQFSSQASVSHDERQRYASWVRDTIAPWNHAGLLTAAAKNMYRYTVAPK